MTVTTTTHLNFRGQAREALETYASIFGGQVQAFTYGDAHNDADGAIPDQLMWGGFESPNGLRLMAFDVPPQRPFDRGADAVFVSVRGDDPVWMLTGPIRATAHALEKTGMSIDDIDLFECNEAFASVVLAWMKETGAPHDKVNVNGGGIALGHPIGATGTRLMTTLLNELERTGGRYGLQTMCEGGGQANVTIIERL